MVRASGGYGDGLLRELWAYRELLYFLAWRDVVARYKQAVLGIGWAIGQPLASTIIFSILFGEIAEFPSEGVPYPVFVMSGTVCWALFASSIQRISVSLVSDSSLLTKVYFPRLTVPTASVGVPLLDFCVAIAMLQILMLWCEWVPTFRIFLLPVLIILPLVFALGVGLCLASINVRYRDVGHIVPFLMSIWMWCTPVTYSTEIVSENWRHFYNLNPMTHMIQALRWCLIGTRPPDLPLFFITVSLTSVLLLCGVRYFQRTERSFADVV